jgi:deferrochelatase/peroxidase EfeB
MTELELDDIQGLILRGYGQTLARHLVLQIVDPYIFKRKLRSLADPSQTTPAITVAEDWQEKQERLAVWPPEREPSSGSGDERTKRRPRHCINIGFTFDGLKQLGVRDDSLQSFPEAFRKGAVARADLVCDTGGSAPEHWEASLLPPNAHVIVSVYADSLDDLDEVTDEICGEARHGAQEIGRFDAQRLPGNVEHFGYVDGLSQPTIEGAPAAGLEDPFPLVPAGEFVLGQRTQRDQPWEPLPEPAELGRNGSFAAFRVMAQDVEAFESFLTTESERAGIDRELLAAKLCGRWRNGEPLVLRPSSASEGAIAHDDRNMFDYEATSDAPADDHEGLLCPRGAHIRRAFPRSQRIVDDAQGFMRRIVRRGIPYDRTDSDGDRERGIVGMFICASLEHQFEYVMHQWLNDGLFTGGGLGRTKDPLTGANGDDSRFVTPGVPRVEAQGFPRFVTTRGAAYLFLPGIGALKHLSALP